LEVIPLRRTQLYLDEEACRVLDELSKKEKKTISQLVREAIDVVYLHEKKPDLLDALARSKGIWSDRKDMDTEKYIRKLRRDTRLKRFGLQK
jgi:hypothetical protein